MIYITNLILGGTYCFLRSVRNVYTGFSHRGRMQTSPKFQVPRPIPVLPEVPLSVKRT